MSRNCERTREACPAERCAPPPKIAPILLKPPEDAERNSYRKFAAQAGKGRDRERNDTAHDLDAAREHDRIGCTKHLQQQVEQDNGDDAGNQGRHGFNIVTSASKSIAGRCETGLRSFHLADQPGRGACGFR